MTRRGIYEPSEHDEQAAVISWAKAMEPIYPELMWLYAIPNAAKRSFRLANRLKAEGMKSGVPDLCLPVPKGGYHGLYIEMKREKAPPSSISPAQLVWRNGLRNWGYSAHFAFGALDAIKYIEAYLREDDLNVA